MNASLKNLFQRLQDIEDKATQNVEPEAAKLYAGTVFSEVVSPLEAINNLVYLLCLPLNSEARAMYAALIENELTKLNEITKRTLTFCKGSPS